MPSGGDLREVTWKNADVGQGRWFSKAGGTHTLDLGGYLTSDDATNIDTGGNFINIKTTKPWSYTIDSVVVDNLNPNRVELETAQALTNSFSGTNFTFGCLDGSVYAGTGYVVGELKHDRSKATFSVTFMGSGILQKI